MSRARRDAHWWVIDKASTGRGMRYSRNAVDRLFDDLPSIRQLDYLLSGRLAPLRRDYYRKSRGHR